MLTQERHQRILWLLHEKKIVTVNELTKELATSESTIRRDLNALHESGLLKKVHGGATVIEEDFIRGEADMATKAERNVSEKSLIGKYAATRIHEDDYVYIDAGTSTEYLVDSIKNNGAKFVTNSILHAKQLKKKGCKVYLIGGEFKLSTEAIIGSEAINSVKKYHFTKCFLGTNGVAVEQGFTTPDIEEALLKQQVIKQSLITFVLADHTKFDKISAISFAELEQAIIITDGRVKQQYKEQTIIKELEI